MADARHDQLVPIVRDLDSRRECRQQCVSLAGRLHATVIDNEQAVDKVFPGVRIGCFARVGQAVE